MKRDMNLIRDLLLFYESDGVSEYPTADPAMVDEHLMLLHEAGLIRAFTNPGDDTFLFPPNGRTVSRNGEELYLFPVSWTGHDFLAAARDQNVWNTAMKVAGGLSLATLKAYLQQLAHEKLGLPAP